MKTRRIFQVVSAFFAFVVTLALLALTVLTILPFFDINLIELDFFTNLHNGLIASAAELSFWDSLGDWAPVVFVAIAFALPAVLLLFAGIIWASKPLRKQGKYVFAGILEILGLGVFAAATEMYAKLLFGDNSLIFMIAIAAGVVLLLLFAFFAMLAKPDNVKNVQPAEVEAVSEQPESSEQPIATEQPEQQTVAAAPNVAATEPVAVEQPSAEPKKVVPQVETVEPIQNVPPMPKPEPPKQPETPLWEQYFNQVPAKQAEPDPQEYIPDERKSTVSDILQNTYRKKTDNISEDNFKKIRTLRSLLDSGTITKDEYIAVVDKYLQESKKQ